MTAPDFDEPALDNPNAGRTATPIGVAIAGCWLAISGIAWLILGVSFVYGFWSSLTGLTSPPEKSPEIS